MAFSSAVLLSLVASAQTLGTPERFTASAINTNNATAGNIDITVTRWSTDKERDTLMSVVDQGTDKLLEALQKLPPVGHFGAPGNLSWDLHFARRIPQPEGGERVILATDRRIGVWEAAQQPRSIEYPFTVIELRLNAEGSGEGKMTVATKVIADKENNVIVLEDYNLQPVQLTNVKREPLH